MIADGLAVSSELGDADALFSAVAEKVLIDGVISAMSDRPAEIIHHIYRRLNNPDRILDAENLVPLTAAEHGALHNGAIDIYESNGVVFCVDKRWNREVRFRLYLEDFRKMWRKYLPA
jgi:hypothetical protein